MTGLALGYGAPAGRAATGTASAIPIAGAGQRAAGSVRFEAVSKTYLSSAGAVHALDGIELEIPAGAIFGIIGRSGAGKSSLLRTINRLEEPSSGRVLIDDEPIGSLDENGLVALRRRIGMIFQHFNLLAAKTVRENVALPLLVAGVPKAEIDRRVSEVIGLVGLQGKEQTYPSRLSGGQKQRVGIARALVSRPEILLCDEATSALDPETTLSILRLLRDINRRLGITIVLITHEMSVIREICSTVVVLEKGRIAEKGPVWQVFGQPRHDATRALLEPLTPSLPDRIAARLLPAPVPGATAVVRIAFSGQTQPDLSALAAAAGTPVRLLQAGVDEIQGHAVGRLLLAIGGGPATDLTERLRRLSANVEVIGYVPADD